MRFGVGARVGSGCEVFCFAAAVAADLAVTDKAARYPPRGGCEVFCFAIETGGRFHHGTEEELKRLAGLARDKCIERGVRPAALLRRWRHQVQSSYKIVTVFEPPTV